MTPDSRSTAAHVLALVIGSGKSLDLVLRKALELHPSARDRAFTQELVYGVLRWYWRLLPQLKTLLKKPLRQRDREIEMLLLIGLYQLQILATPAHAAVAATVDACTEINKTWAKGLVNATLRNAIRQVEKLTALTDNSASARTAHPDWFIELVRRDWPEHWHKQLAANNEHPPFTLRINSRRVSRDSYLGALESIGLAAHKTKYSEQGIRLDKAVPVESLPEFEQGAVSVQDEAAQLAMSTLDLPESGRVLDACAAPGGKAAHILESSDNRLEVVAIDRSAQRMVMLQESMERLGITPIVHTANAMHVGQWWDGELFDRILVDAPCSGSGVIRRHPDIKIHRRLDDIQTLATQQRHLLEALWPLLKSGGKLVYATCSILKAENDQVIARFIEGCDSATLEYIDTNWGVETEFGRQIIADEENMDGFYYARLGK